MPRSLDRASELNQETKNARIWLGVHFRKAMDDGNRIGRKIADATVRTVFRPVG